MNPGLRRPLTQLCCLVAVLVVGAARPNAEVSQRDARAQTVLDTSDPFWVFKTPDKPIVYIPTYDAILIPERDVHQHPFPAVQGLASILPYQPPRRRRPILAVIDLLQKRYSQQASVGSVGSSAEVGAKDDMNVGGEKYSKISASTEPSKEKGNNCSEEKHPKPEENNSTSFPNRSEDEAEKKLSRKVPQLSRISSLLDELIKDHPDLSDGFSYAYKYALPNKPSKLDSIEVSVQQSLKRIPDIPEEPLEDKFFKAPVNYQKAQEKLDTLLEESSKAGESVHLNTPGAFGPLLLSQELDKQADGRKPSSEEAIVLEVPEGRTVGSQEPTRLMLRPVAKAVAGPRGVAVASPVAKAVLRRGQKVTLDYDPDAVAIAGPGGRAHAHPEFSVDYIESGESE